MHPTGDSTALVQEPPTPVEPVVLLRSKRMRVRKPFSARRPLFDSLVCFTQVSIRRLTAAAHPPPITIRAADGCSRVLASFPTFKPPAQRRLCFTGPSTSKKAFDTDVLIEIWPMNSFALPNESPIRPFPLASMCEPRVPGHGHRDRPAIDEIDYQRVLSDRHTLRACFAEFNR